MRNNTTATKIRTDLITCGSRCAVTTAHTAHSTDEREAGALNYGQVNTELWWLWLPWRLPFQVLSRSAKTNTCSGDRRSRDALPQRRFSQLRCDKESREFADA